MSSATSTQTASHRRPSSRARYRSRNGARFSKEAEQDFSAVLALPDEVESEIDVELTSPRPTGRTMSTGTETSVHHHSAAKPLKKVSRTGSQVSVVEVNDGWPISIETSAAGNKNEVDVGSWRRRAAKSPGRLVSPGLEARRSARDHSADPDLGRRVPTVPSGAAHQDPAQALHPRRSLGNPPRHADSKTTVASLTESQRRASVPVSLASYPHASVPSVPYTQLPDLNRIRPIRPALVAEQLLLSEPCQLPRTREFALAPPPYSDADIPPPTPYNEAYPHPLTSYASPGVNASTVKLSGYDVELAKLMQVDRAKALGTILASCDRPGITAPTLAKHLRSYIPDGNGIPGFDNEGAARAALGPVGAAICRGDERLNELTGGGNGGSGIQPVFTPALNHMPPRLAAQARAETRMREAHSLSMSSASEISYRPLTPPATPRNAYHVVKLPSGDESIDALGMPHPSALRRASVVSDLAFGRGSHLLPTDYFQQQSFPIISPTAEMPRPQSPSSFLKTELCPAYQETGQCKYGKGCQFAHGLRELRLPLSRTAFTFPAPAPMVPPMVSTLAYQHISGATSPMRSDLRRASAPHSNLGTVQETEDDQFPFPIFTPGRRQSDISPTPNGDLQVDRPIRQASIARLGVPRQAFDVARDLALSFSSDMPSTPNQTPVSTSFTSALATPSDRLSPVTHRDQQHVIHPRASDSSLSSAGYLPKESYLPSDETTPTRVTAHHELAGTSCLPRGQPTSPIAADAASNGSWGSGPKTQSNKSNSNSTSATVDFSTGRSIWC